MPADLVSIITPAYRAAASISQTIESVLAQTHTNWEMWIADDCSPDNTRAVVDQWCQRDSRIHLIELARNGGPAAARNAALDRARGQWIAFLDSDDHWLPEKLERSLRHAHDTGAALVYTGFRRIRHDNGRVGRYIRVPRSLTYRELLGHTAIATSTVLMDRRQTGDVRMQPVYYDDFVCWLGLLQRGLKARGLNEDLMRYGVAGQSVSSNKRNSARQVWRIYREVLGFGPLASGWHFARYAVRGWLKHRRF